MSEEQTQDAVIVAYIDEDWNPGWEWIDNIHLQEWLDNHKNYHQREICRNIKRLKQHE